MGCVRGRRRLRPLRRRAGRRSSGMGCVLRPGRASRRRPLDPWKCRAVEYRPFVETIRASVRHAGAIRIDHALGLARMFWVPAGAPPSKGVYVRYPYADLLDVIAQESERAGSFVVGEDLGTSTPEILEALASRRLLSYRLLWFEETPPSEFPMQAMAAVTTHDLPTVAGLWTGSDMRTQQELGL